MHSALSELIPRAHFALAMGVLGLFLGSFFNVCISRWGSKESIAWPPSHCDSCGAKLYPWELIPVVSWLCLKGRCGHCGAKLSIQYPAMELLTGVAFALVAYATGCSADFLVYALFTGLFIVLSGIDLRLMILPDVLTWPAALLAAILAIFVLGRDPFEVLAGGAVGFGFFWLVAVLFAKLRNIEGLGGGDVKLMLTIGCLSGLFELPFVVTAAGLLGLAGFALAGLLGNKTDGQRQLPFGPCLCLAGWIAMIWGREILLWWVQLLR